MGFGGIYVEVLRDTAARPAPVARADALAMLDELRMAPLLRGVRGEPPADREAIAEVIRRLGPLAVDTPELAEVELNPLVAGPGGAVAVDARGSLDGPAATAQEAARDADGGEACPAAGGLLG